MLEKIRTYARITKLWAIARRYFVNNFYDGMLTVLGILLGFFIVIINGNQTTIESNLVILTGIGSSISMFVSGMSGSYLSERAEQKKMKMELHKAMALNKLDIDDSNPFLELSEIEKAMLIKIKKRRLLRRKRASEENQKKTKTIQDKAERFTSIVVAIVNGSSPFFGGLVPLIPFFLIEAATFFTFITSFFIILICIILLGTFLGFISKESIVKNIIQMVFAFLVTILISFLLLL